MAKPLPDSPTPDPSSDIQPRRIVAGGVSALLVFIVNGIFDEKDDASLRQILAPLASIFGLVAGSALAGLYEFLGKVWVTLSNDWLSSLTSERKLERGLRKNIKELQVKLADKRTPLTPREIRKINLQIKKYEQLIMDSRHNKFTISASSEPPGSSPAQP